MSDVIKIKRGVDIKLVGQAEQIYANADQAETFAIKPIDFPGTKLKLAVREGDEVKAGSPVMFHKDRPEIKFCSPVSGEVAKIVRGDKRRLLEVRILADQETRYDDFGTADISSLDGDSVKSKLLASGCWPFIRQRPYNIVANPERRPKSIFISCFNSAPLSSDMDFVVHGMEKEFQTGIDALATLTDGKIHLGFDGSTNPSSVFTECRGVEVHRFVGPHPVGNVGVQINKVDPLNKGDVVWTLNPQDVIIIGRLFMEGRYNAQINIAVAGSEVLKPRYYKTIVGASIKNFVADNVSDKVNRFISGDVLTGTNVGAEGYLGFYERMITIIPEGDKDELFGWLMPGLDKFSISRTMFGWMMPNRKYKLDTGMHGEERAFVVTGELERVFPFDIYPLQLVKSIMVRDVEAMENLGIYEVAEEDFALCEVINTSKIPIQQTVREGLNLMQQELGD